MQPGTPRTLLRATALIEAGAGGALLVAPALVAQFLLGATLPSAAALLVARIAGAALLAIGLSCWLEGRRPGALAPGGLVGGLLAYNALVCALLLHAASLDGLRGIGIWPACALHLAMAIWCALVLRAGARAAAQHSAS